jgi:hypothetical protein
MPHKGKKPYKSKSGHERPKKAKKMRKPVGGKKR